MLDLCSVGNVGHLVTFDITVCSDRLDPFFIERGRPAEREIGKRETGGIYVGVGEIQDKPAYFTPPPPIQQPDKGSQMVSTSPTQPPCIKHRDYNAESPGWPLIWRP